MRQGHGNVALRPKADMLPTPRRKSTPGLAGEHVLTQGVSTVSHPSAKQGRNRVGAFDWWKVRTISDDVKRRAADVISKLLPVSNRRQLVVCAVDDYGGHRDRRQNWAQVVTCHDGLVLPDVCGSPKPDSHVEQLLMDFGTDIWVKHVRNSGPRQDCQVLGAAMAALALSRRARCSEVSVLAFVSSNARRVTRSGARRMISSATMPPIETPASANRSGACIKIRAAIPGRLVSDRVSPTIQSASVPRASIVGCQTVASLPSPGIITIDATMMSPIARARFQVFR